MERSGEKRMLGLEEALSLNPMGLFQWRLLLMCGFAFMADSLEVNLLSFLATCAGDEWGLSDAQQASITGIVFAGIILGTLFWGLFADKYGRRLTYFFACALISIGGFLSGASPSYEWLIFFRAIAGFGIGGANVPFDLLAEFLPASHRGKFLIYIEYFWTFGSLFVTGLAWASLESTSWRVLAYLTAIPVTVASAVSILYLPESPRWLLIKARKEEAEKVIRDAALVNGVDMEPFSLIHDEADNHVEDAGYLDLWRDKSARNTTFPLSIVWLMFGFTYYGIILFVGRLYAEDDDGSSKCSFDYPAIFTNAAAEVAGVTIGAYAIDVWGRVYSQSVFYGLGGIAVFLMGFMTDPDAVTTVGVIGRLCALAASNATWVTTPELYSTEMRTVGHALCVAASKLGAFFSPFLVISDTPAAVVGLILGLMNIVGAVACNFLPETKDLNLDEKDELRSSLNKNSFINDPVDPEVENAIHQQRPSAGVELRDD